MLYERSYIRQNSGYPNNYYPFLKWIFIINLSVFILQNFFQVWLGTFAFNYTFALSGENIRKGLIWTLFSYGLLHNGLFHFLINSLLLYLVGKNLQAFMGGKVLMQLYIICVIGGGLFYLLFHFFDNGTVMGASGGVAGIITLFCLLHYNQPITIYIYFILPVTLKGKTILLIFAGIELFGLLFSELGGASLGIAHSSHIGGMLAAICFFRFFFNSNASKSPLNLFFQSILQRIQRMRQKGMLKKGEKAADYHYMVNLTNRQELRKEADRVLDKINEKGFSSLTQEERKILDHLQKIIKR